MSINAVIANISRASLHDGPGVRTVVYFKGCSLRCQWCHNPETICMQAQILYAPTKCICCGRCIQICPQQHQIRDGRMEFVHQGCTLCGRCAQACPANALSLCGKQMSVPEVLEEVSRDMHYYTQTGGGVTLSGGECLLQADFCGELLKQCQSLGIHTMVESALFVPWNSIQKVIPFCDGFFADFKIADPGKHKTYTGQDNGLIGKNLKKLAARMPGNVTVRIPLIPGVNDGPEDIAGFAASLLQIAPLLKGIEVLRYNNLARSKYEQAGRAYTDFGQPQTDEALLAYRDRLKQALNNKTEVFTVL